jgi:hypothetical protein
MSAIYRRYLVRALVVAALVASPAAAGEVVGELVFCHKKKCQSCAPATACYDPCCDPCKVGPIRRFFRGCHRKPCAKPCCPPAPACCPPAPALVIPGGPVAPAQVIVPATPPAGFAPPAPAPANVPPPPVFPGTGSSLRRSGTLTPPVAPPPVRADRIANHAAAPITLVHSEKRSQERAATDEDGRFRATLAVGTWHIYSKDVEGKQVYRGKLEVREAGLITVRMR